MASLCCVNGQAGLFMPETLVVSIYYTSNLLLFPLIFVIWHSLDIICQAIERGIILKSLK